MRRRLVLRNREAQNRRAGASLHAREVRGRHGENPGYRPGDNWSTCQRCGFDVYASDLREDGYKPGLMVCPKCYDPPHPQDYVRVWDDNTDPLDGSTGSLDSYSTVAAVGSTSLPLGSFPANPPQWTAIPAQTNDTGDTITTLSLSTYAAQSYVDDFGQTIAIASYSVPGLPAGLSLDSSTGDITGTISVGADALSPYSLAPVAIYADGYTTSTTLSWTVDDGGLLPTDISNLVLWWDFSEDEYVWANEALTTPITDGTLIRGVTDRSGNGFHGTIESDGNAPRWESGERNGLGVADADIEGGSPRCLDTIGASIELDQPYTMIGVAQLPIPDATDADVLLSHRGIDGTQFEVTTTGAGGVARLYTIVSSSVGEISDGTALGDNAGEWYMFLLMVDGDDTNLTFNKVAGSPDIEHDTNTENIQETFRFGAGTDTSANIRTGWNAPMGEAIVFNKELTSDEIDGLFLQLSTKWSLTDEING